MSEQGKSISADLLQARALFAFLDAWVNQSLPQYPYKCTFHLAIQKYFFLEPHHLISSSECLNIGLNVEVSYIIIYDHGQPNFIFGRNPTSKEKTFYEV